MLIAAIVGGFVAARLSGLRRTADGVLHGAVAWGATTVLYALLATTAIGTLTAGMFGLLAPGAQERAAPATAPLTSMDRDQAQRALESAGLTPEQARTIVDQLAPPDAASGGSMNRQMEQAADTVGTATTWLTVTVLLSLILSVIGGSFGVRGSRRVNRRIAERDYVANAPPAEPTAHVLSKQAQG